MVVFFVIGALGGNTSSDNTTNDNTLSNSSEQTQNIQNTSSKILTAEKYNSIDFGMTYKDVVAIIGEEGENISEVAVADIVTTIYQWEDGLVNCNITVQNDEITAKAQFGIITSDSKITMEMYNSIENGMTYEEVVEIFGAEGAPLSSSKLLDSITIIYMWNGNTFGGNCNITFQDNSVFAKSQYGLE